MVVIYNTYMRAIGLTTCTHVKVACWPEKDINRLTQFWRRGDKYFYEVPCGAIYLHDISQPVC